jgi:SAM-dependent methyltransferase
MIQDTVDFYEKESGHYTAKRYPEITTSYTQYLFKKRLKIFLVFLIKIEKDLPQNATILEIGCADGVLFKAIEEKFPNRFSKLVGTDISPKMIEEARRQNTNTRASFCLRDELRPEKFDLVIELGVHPFDLDGELNYVSGYLNSKGYFFYNLGGLKSLYARFKLKDKPYIKDYKTYSLYEKFLSKYFSIEASQVYSLFIPWLWKIPFVGRSLQPVFDFVFRGITPELFHEKIYLLKKKS